MCADCQSVGARSWSLSYGRFVFTLGGARGVGRTQRVVATGHPDHPGVPVTWPGTYWFHFLSGEKPTTPFCFNLWTWPATNYEPGVDVLTVGCPCLDFINSEWSGNVFDFRISEKIPDNPVLFQPLDLAWLFVVPFFIW